MCIMRIIVISVKNALTGPLTFQSQNRIISQDHSNTKIEQFGVIRFWVMLQTNRQTDRETEPNILPTRTDSVDVRN